MIRIITESSDDYEITLAEAVKEVIGQWTDWKNPGKGYKKDFSQLDVLRKAMDDYTIRSERDQDWIVKVTDPDNLESNPKRIEQQVQRKFDKLGFGYILFDIPKSKYPESWYINQIRECEASGRYIND